MLHVTESPSARADSSSTTARPELDRAVAAVGEQRRKFAKLPAKEKAGLLREVLQLLSRVSRGWVDAGCDAKGIVRGSVLSGEEWLAGPVITARNVRLLAKSLDDIASGGRPPLGRGVITRPDGRVEIDVFPAGGFDSVLYRGLSCVALLEAGVDQANARERQASFYQKKSPEGGVSLVLGAGNVSSIPACDALHKMFVDGNVCVLKMNPVNEWVGPFLEQAFAPLIRRDFLRIVYGGGDVGEYLCGHSGIQDIHITGSNRTHDRIVWGPPGAEQERRRKANDPVLKKTITSELGNVSPVVIVPGKYTDEELKFQVKNVVTMVVNNASFNCNAAKMLVTSRGWAQRGQFFDQLAATLGEVPTRKAYYPGARDRYEELVGPHPSARRIGAEGAGMLPWTLITDLDSSAQNESLFQIEPFCGILSQTDLGESDPAAFLPAATKFCNERLWGTLNVAVIIDPRAAAAPPVATALDRAILDLKYGTVAINHWPALVFGAGSTPWGGHPSATLADVQSGIGFVHNTFMLEGIEKSVFRGPITMSPKPAWFYDNAMMRDLASKTVDFEVAPSALKLPGLAITAMRG